MTDWIEFVEPSGFIFLLGYLPGILFGILGCRLAKKVSIEVGIVAPGIFIPLIGFLIFSGDSGVFRGPELALAFIAVWGIFAMLTGFIWYLKTRFYSLIRNKRARNN